MFTTQNSQKGTYSGEKAPSLVPYKQTDVRVLVNLERDASRETHKNPFILKHGIPAGSPNELRFDNLPDPDRIDAKEHRVLNFGKQ
jgi:hypothetical protein